MYAFIFMQFHPILDQFSLNIGKKYIAQGEFDVKSGLLLISESFSNFSLLLSQNIGVEPFEHASIPVQLMIGFS